ncbi:MAG TPA: M1 family aminopeptidase [Streptosporangiaceae bacterium]|nr:M1 family aminopeptidase [Streptosporangiaceae bacterium]
MARFRRPISLAIGVVALAAAGPVPSALASRATPAPASGSGRCSAGAHSLSSYGSRLYPETGNGGYRSVHTGVHMVYDAGTNVFLPGNNVALTDQATQCLTSFSLDFERTSANTAAGPDLSVSSVTVNGQPARFAFVQPTYPGDPKGAGDPDPLAHEASQTSPVGGPDSNPLPPACTPELHGSQGDDALDGTQCPANKLVITPDAPIRDRARFTVVVNYTGRPGVHSDGDGSTEGWFAAPGGSFVTTEPVGTEDWMPLNDYPAAKPVYDFYDTINAGKTALANGELKSVSRHGPDSEFPAGSVTYHWASGAPVASYLVEDSVGNYTLTSRRASDGLIYYEAQDSSISAAQQAANQAIMNQQQDITDFENQFSGPFPFPSDGVVVGTPPASFEEEMQTMITFAGGQIDLDTLYHENMHQWWGDHVTEGGYNMTFYKEGMATLAEYMYSARKAETAAGGPGTAAGRQAFTSSLIAQFNKLYARTGSFWSAAPSNPDPAGLFSNSATYDRPGAAYIALWQILGTSRFTQVLRGIQREYGGGSITEPELEAAYQRGLPNQSHACHAELSKFFGEWFDTAYPTAAGAAEPDITGPGLAGPGFSC